MHLIKQCASKVDAKKKPEGGCLLISWLHKNICLPAACSMAKSNTELMLFFFQNKCNSPKQNA